MHDTSALPLGHEVGVMNDEVAQVQAAQHDPTAFAPLYYRYRDRIYLYLRTRTKTEDDAADLMQQVFLHALRALHQYRPRRGPFVAWLFGIARNAAANFHQRQCVTMSWDLVPEALQPLAAYDLEAGVLHREDIQRLQALFLRLDHDKREMLVLRFVVGLSVAEIAAVIGKSEGATQKSMYRVIQTLKEQYHDELR